PRTAIAIRPDPTTISADGLPGLDPTELAELPESSSAIVDDTASAAGSLRAYGRDLYKHPAVKAWVASPYEPLDTVALFAGRSVPTETRLSIEAGLRRRDTASAIAALLEVPA